MRNKEKKTGRSERRGGEKAERLKVPAEAGKEGYNALGSLDRQFILYLQYDYKYCWENNLKRPLKIYT